MNHKKAVLFFGVLALIVSTSSVANATEAGCSAKYEAAIKELRPDLVWNYPFLFEGPNDVALAFGPKAIFLKVVVGTLIISPVEAAANLVTDVVTSPVIAANRYKASKLARAYALIQEAEKGEIGKETLSFTRDLNSKGQKFSAQQVSLAIRNANHQESLCRDKPSNRDEILASMKKGRLPVSAAAVAAAEEQGAANAIRAKNLATAGAEVNFADGVRTVSSAE